MEFSCLGGAHMAVENLRCEFLTVSGGMGNGGACLPYGQTPIPCNKGPTAPDIIIIMHVAFEDPLLL